MRRALAVLCLAVASACGPEPDRGLLYAHPEARSPFFKLDRAAGVYRSARTGAAESEFAAVKPAGTFRVFVLGGSIARMYSDAGSLQDTLPVLLPGRRVEVINAGMSGYDSAREEIILREVLGLGADAVVLLSGHNEFTTLSPPLPLWRLRLGLWAAGGRPKRQGSAFMNDAKRINARLAAFEDSLRRMARASRAKGAALVLVRPPLNLRDGAPQTSLPRGPEFTGGWMRVLLGDCRGGREAWTREKAGAGEGAAVVSFMTARCLEIEGRPVEAAAAYARALDLDQPLRGRCETKCADILARVAQEEGVLLADAHAEFLRRSGTLPPGMEAFHDRIHWRPERNETVSFAVAHALSLAGLTATPVRPARAAPRPEPGRDGWMPVLRYAAWEVQNAGEDTAPTALAFLERALKGWPAAARERGLLADIARDSARPGLAWGMPGLERIGPAFSRHMALALLLAGDVKGAARLQKEAGPPAHWQDRLHLIATLTRLGEKSRAREEFAAAWALGEGRADPARDASLTAAARALPLGLVAARVQRESARGDPYARWTSALSSGTLVEEVRRDPDAARAVAGRREAGALAEALYAALGDDAAARAAACRPGRAASSELSCARHAKTAEAARKALSSASDAASLRAAAILLQDAGDAAGAARELRKLSDAAPADAGLACDAGTALFLAGDKAAARKAFQRASGACAAAGLSLLGR